MKKNHKSFTVENFFKIGFCILGLNLSLFAQKLEIESFVADLYSKNGKNISKKISMDMLVEGRDVEDGSYKVIDALNVVIGSFYAEDLLTSKGKLAFKKALIKYTSKTYSVEIDNIYIQSFFILDNPKIDEIVQALKKEGCCSSSTSLPSLYKEKKEQKNKPKIPKEDDDDIIVIE